MRAWVVAGVVVAACTEGAPPPCAHEPSAGAAAPAYVGFRWACANAPPCADTVGCDDPGWQRLGAVRLDAAAACLLGPCERRRECLDEALAMCRTQ